MKQTLLALLLLGTSLLAQAQTIRYVKPAASGTGDGSSWTNASSDLQAMINASAATHQVWVAAGLYKPTTTTDRSISFTMKNGVAIYGGFVGNETQLSGRPAINPVGGQPSSTTLSGDIGTVGNAGDNSYNVIITDGLNNTAILDGVVITAGGHSYSYGGGMYNNSSSPVLTNVSFHGNTAQVGGAMYNQFNSNPTLTNVSFYGNTARAGGGMLNDSSSPVLTNVSFQGNYSEAGGGMCGNNSSPVLTNVSFQGNTASYQGGAMYCQGCSPVLTNVSFQGNSASYQGGAMYNYSNTYPVLTNVSFQGNTAQVGGVMYNTDRCSLSLTNCVVFGNGGDNNFFSDVGDYGSSVSATYCLFENTVTGYGSDPTNLTTTSSPFASPTTTQLAAGSPAIDAGSSAANGYPTDLAGNSRVVGCRIDMGAYELQATAFTPLAFISQPPAGSAVCPGGSVTLSVSTTGSVTGYQWYKDGQVLSPPQATTSLSLTGVQPTDAGSYSLVVTGVCNSVTSTAFSLTVNALPTVSITPSSTAICTGQTTLLTASVGSAYAWSSQASMQAITVGSTGPYSVTVTDANGCSNTATASVTVNPLPMASLINNGPLSEAMPVVTLTAGGGSTYAFSGGANQPGGPSSTTATVSQTGTYSVRVSAPNGCTASATSTVTGAASKTVCRGGTTALSVVTTGVGLTYQWYKNGQTAANKLIEIASIQKGTTTASLTLVNAQVSATYYVKVADGNGGISWYGPVKASVNANCSGRVAAEARGGESLLEVVLLANPLTDGRVRALVRGAQGGPLQVQLLDMRGRAVGHQRWEEPAQPQLIDWDVSGQAPGVYLLQVVTVSQAGPAQLVTLKVVNP